MRAISFNLRQQRFVVYSFFVILAVFTTYFLLTMLTSLQVAKQINESEAVHRTVQAASESLKTLREAVDVEIWKRVKDLPLENSVLIKLLQDIIAIQLSNKCLPNCEQYVLKVRKSGMFPVLQTTINGRSEIKDWIWLNVGEVWRYGSTKLSKEERYPGGVFSEAKMVQ